MADNTLLNVGASGDKIRTLDRNRADGAKVEVVQLDFGGGDVSPETLVSTTTPLPVAPPQTPADADGVPFSNTAAPSSDVATGSRQVQIIDAIIGQALNPAGPTTVAVGITSVAVVALNLGRRGLVLTNTSTSGQIISLHLSGGAAVANSGIVLWPGDAWTMDRYSFTTGAINGIASAASGVIGFQEFN